MTARKFVHIPAQMLNTHLVISAVVAPLEERPKALNSVRVGHEASVEQQTRLLLWHHPGKAE